MPSRQARKNRFVLGVFLAVATLVAGCNKLPSDGPLTREIIEESATGDFVLVTMTDAISQALMSDGERGFGPVVAPASAGLPQNRIAVGDVLGVRILEAGTNGPFASGGGLGHADFPKVLVGADGNISLPYVGTIRALGRKPRDIEQDIVERLAGSAIEPQAVVGVVESASNIVTVAGDAGRPGPLPLTLRPTRLAEVIAAAGGSRYPAYDTRVTLVRDGRRGSLNLMEVMESPSHNPLVQRGDMVVLAHQPRSFTINGAVGRGGVFPFETARMTLLDALGRAGGLSDMRADPKGVFVFRFEPVAKLKRLGIPNLARFENDPRGVPTVYRIDMQQVRSRFFAQSFYVRSGDAIYVSNSETVQTQKLLTLFDLSVGTGASLVGAGADIAGAI